MQPAISIGITTLMGLTAIFFPIRLSITARELNFTPERRTLVTVLAFILIGGWFGLVLWGALSGFFQIPIRITGVPVPIPQVAYLSLGPVIVGSLLIAFSATTRQLLDAWRPERTMIIQTARVIGGVFILRYLAGDMPALFALPAGIGDVFIGVTAPIMAYLYATRGDKIRGLAIAWNFLGLLDLANALISGFLVFSARLGTAGVQTAGPAVAPITAFPLVLIPAFGVPLTILVHIITLRMLLKKREPAR